ncbi:MAG: preprotein translocase subunit SecG [Alphaproteobacteria bacterium]|nr:preprotein translocase subunit SecG [Alphaproteobacteria bacterium]
MITALLIIHLLIILAMIGIILIQRNEGGALGIGGGATAGLMTARGTANLLTRATAVLAVAFFFMTVVIAGVFKSSKNVQSIVDEEDELGILETTRPVINKTKTTDLSTAEPKKMVKTTPGETNKVKEVTSSPLHEKPNPGTPSQGQPKDAKKVK